MYMTDIVVGLEARGLDFTVYTRGSQAPDGGSSTDDHDYNGASVKRLPVPDLGRRSMLHRAASWVLFTVVVSLTLLMSRSEGPREVVFVSYPPILPLAIYAVCRFRGWDYTYIVHDLYPDAAVELGYLTENGIVHRLWKGLNRNLLAGARNVVALGPTMRDRIVAGVGEDFDEEKVAIVHHWADGEFIVPREKENNWFSQEHGTVDEFTLVYAGNIGEFHDIETVVRAVARIEDDDIRFLIIGEGDNKQSITTLADELGVLGECVDILPYQPWEDVPYSLTCGDVSVVAKNEGFEGVSVSSKIYSSLATGQPILVVARHHADEARMVEAADAGVAVPPGDTDGVVACIREWKDNPNRVAEQGRNAREAFESRFSAEIGVEQYYELLNRT